MYYLTLFSLLLIFPHLLMAEAPQSPWQQAEKIAQETDIAKACEFLASLPDALAATSEFQTLVQRNYRAKNIPGMIQYGQAGIQFALQSAARLPEQDAPVACELRGRAKAIAYNLSANLWPGWKEPGIHLNATDLALGLQFAKTNLRLAIELDKQGEPLGHAYWLLGAHALAANDSLAAVTAFRTAAKHYAGDYALMSAGYAALAARLSKEEAEVTAGTEQFTETLTLLRKSTGKDGKFFAAQLEMAVEVFLPRK